MPDPSAKTILLFSPDEALPAGFLASCGGAADQTSLVTEVDGEAVTIRVFGADLARDDVTPATEGGADAMVLLVRFLDALSMARIKTYFDKIYEQEGVQTGVVIMRESGEFDFKVACPHCGQKLWVHDVDVGKRGRCPSCKKAFTLISQAETLRKHLGLLEKEVVPCAFRGDRESCVLALEHVLGGRTNATTGVVPPLRASKPVPVLLKPSRPGAEAAPSEAGKDDQGAAAAPLKPVAPGAAKPAKPAIVSRPPAAAEGDEGDEEPPAVSQGSAQPPLQVRRTATSTKKTVLRLKKRP